MLRRNTEYVGRISGPITSIHHRSQSQSMNYYGQKRGRHQAVRDTSFLDYRKLVTTPKGSKTITRLLIELGVLSRYFLAT